jgi:hypothetical protein
MCGLEGIACPLLFIERGDKKTWRGENVRSDVA